MEKKKAIELAIKCIKEIMHQKYKGRADAIRYGIAFGTRATDAQIKHEEAIKILEELLEEQ